MATMADEIYLLCDSSKVEKNAYVRFAPLSLIDALITDKDMDPSLVNEYKIHEVRIIN
jgi:DeoR family fructose operon transcriptional repressor